MQVERVAENNTRKKPYVYWRMTFEKCNFLKLIQLFDQEFVSRYV